MKYFRPNQYPGTHAKHITTMWETPKALFLLFDFNCTWLEVQNRLFKKNGNLQTFTENCIPLWCRATLCWNCSSGDAQAILHLYKQKRWQGLLLTGPLQKNSLSRASVPPGPSSLQWTWTCWPFCSLPSSLTWGDGHLHLGETHTIPAPIRTTPASCSRVEPKRRKTLVMESMQLTDI